MTAGRQEGQVVHFQLDARTTDCSCPRCGRKHKLKINWIGRGVPIKFCHNCNRRLNNLRNDEVPSVVKRLEYLQRPERIWRKCKCHEKYVFACPNFKARWSIYKYFREVEIDSLGMGTMGL